MRPGEVAAVVFLLFACAHILFEHQGVDPRFPGAAAIVDIYIEDSEEESLPEATSSIGSTT